MKMKWMIAGLFLLSCVGMADVITIDNAYNGGSNVAEYRAWDTTNPFDGVADAGNANNESLATVGVFPGYLNRTALFFEVPAGYTSAQITNVVLNFYISNPSATASTDMDIYFSSSTSVGTQDAAFAKDMFEDSSFSNTGLYVQPTVDYTQVQSFDVTSLIKNAVDQGENVVAFRFQLSGDTALDRNVRDLYNIFGHGNTDDSKTPSIVLQTVPEPSSISLVVISTGILLFTRRCLNK